jgi:hypothetical protein
MVLIIFFDSVDIWIMLVLYDMVLRPILVVVSAFYIEVAAVVVVVVVVIEEKHLQVVGYRPGHGSVYYIVCFAVLIFC